MNNKNLIGYIAIIFSIITISSSLRLIPDTSMPLMMIKPTSKELNTQILFKFQFPANSKGLLNKQVLGVTFPKSLGISETIFDLYSKNNFRYGCELYLDKTLIQSTPVIYNPNSINYSTENNIAYCKIDDPYNTPLLPTDKKTITLIIKLSEIMITSLNFIRGLDLFTATNSSSDKIIIDTLINVGSLAIYGDAINPPPLEIVTATPLVTSGPVSNKIYILNSFDMILTVKVNQFISYRDSLFLVKIPIDAVSLPTAVTTSNSDPTDPLQIAVKSNNLSLQKFSTDSVSISGINEDLNPGRQFILTIKNFNSLSKQISQNLEIIVYYLNSYSQISYSVNPCLVINYIALENVSIGHPEGSPIYSGHAWPMDFSFNVNTDIKIPTLVAIQHTNAIETAKFDGGRKLNFQSATCDFSMNGSFNTFFGVRPKCYPMRLDLEYPNTSNLINFSGSGIIFKVNNLTARMIYKLRVWIMFDYCGNTTNPLVLDEVDNKLMPNSIMNYSIIIYQFNKSNKTKLSYNNGIQFTDSIEYISDTTCWNSSNNEKYTITTAVGSTPEGDWLSSNPTNKKLILLSKEINNFDLIDTTNNYGKNSSHDSASNFYINADSNKTNYVYIKSDYTLKKDDFNYNYFPFNLSFNASVSPQFTKLSGYLEFKFSNNGWVEKGDYVPNVASCQVNWGFKGDKNDSTSPNSFRYNVQGATQTTLDSYSNLIYVSNLSSINPTIKLSSMVFPDTSIKGMTLISSIYMDSTISKFDFSSKHLTTTNADSNESFLIYTDCLKINSTRKIVKTLYDYFEATISFIYSATETDVKAKTVRVIRYLKLFTAGGAFNDVTAETNFINFKSPTAYNYFKYHYINSSSQDNNSVCILELSSQYLKLFTDKTVVAKDPNSYILSLNLFNVNIIDTDYENISLNYPILQSSKDDSIVESDYFQNSLTISPYNKLYKGLLDYDGTKLYNSDFNSKLVNLAFFSSNIKIYNLKTIKPDYSFNSSTLNNNIIIPTLCPLRKYADSTTNYFTFPIVTSYFYSLNSLGFINNKIYFGGTETPTSTNRNIFLSYFKKTNLYQNFYSTLRFDNYSVDNPNMKIYFGTNLNTGLYGQVKDKINCSAISFLISSDIDFDKTKLDIKYSTILTTDKIFYSLTSPLNSNYFFVNKIGFNKLIIALTAAATDINTTANNKNLVTTNPVDEPDIILKGITRPTIENFIVNINSKNYLSYVDKIAFFCINELSADNSVYSSNFITYTASNFNIANFILDIEPDKTSEWSYILKDKTKSLTSITLDRNDLTLYQSEISGNMNLQVYLPKYAANGSILSIESANNFNPNTLCGITNSSNNLTHDCYFQNYIYSKIYCPYYSKTRIELSKNVNDGVLDPNTYMNICCYNISINEKIYISSLNLGLESDPTIKGLSFFTTPNLFTEPAKIANYLINNQSLPMLKTLSQVTISSMIFIYANHLGAISKLRMTIKFPREIIRNSKIILSASLSNMLIPNINQECFISNTDETSKNKIEPFVETCSLNLQNNSRTIIIKFKKIIYSCGITLPNSFVVTITPVKVIDISNNSYKINWFLNDSGDNITNLDISQIFPSISYDFNLIGRKPIVTDRWGSLCNIISIYPRLISEYAYYDFEINSNSLNSGTESISVNELSIFFPSNLFSDENLSNLNCLILNLNKNINCKCLLEEKGILSVKFDKNFLFYNESTIVRIIGILNPTIENDIYFPCTLNNIQNIKNSKNYNSRYNTLVGSGVLKGGLNNVITKFGNLRIFNSQNFVSDTNPRLKGIYIIKMGFDYSSGITLPFAITNNLVLIINFPEEYNIYAYAYSQSLNSLLISATIEEFTASDTNVIQTNGMVPIGGLDYINNSILLSLTDTTRTFPVNFRYWQIKLNFVPAPMDNIKTGSYGLVLTNYPNTFYIKTFTNSDTFFNDLNTSSTDPFIQYYRGINFYFDNIKIILDLIDKNNSTNLNRVTLNPGFFKEVYIIARTNSRSFKSSITQILLEDQIFVTDQTSYNFSTSNPRLIIKLGVSCNTLKGYYYINFKVTNTDDFIGMAPIKIFVDDIEPSIINLETNTNIPSGSSQLITYNLSENNVDILDIIWEPDSKNDYSAVIDKISIYPLKELTSALFSITNPNITTNQIFTSKNPNSCFKLNTNSLSFSFNSTYPDLKPFIDNPEKFKSQFYLYNQDSFSILKANSIMFTYTPLIFPLYLFCGIVCIDSELPSDEDVLSTPNNNYFFQKYIFSNTKLQLNFSNLMKNSLFKIKCIAQTTQTNVKERQQIVVEISKLNQIENSSLNLINISTSSIPKTKCLRFKFKKDLGNIVKDAMITYCQNSFKTIKGCVVCIDNVKRNSLGIDPNTYFGCNLNEGNKNIQIINENQIIDGPLKIDDYNYFSICLLQDLFCETTLNREEYQIEIFKLLQNLSSDSLITQNVKLPNLQLNEVKVISDENPPDLEKLVVNFNYADETGYYSFTVSNPNPIYCYYGILVVNSLYSPAFEDIINCVDYSRCGIAKISSVSSVIFGNKSNLRIFVNGKYSIWFACVNDIPNPRTKSKSVVKGEFQINSFKQSLNTNTKTNISGCFVKYRVGFLILILFILLL